MMECSQEPLVAVPSSCKKEPSCVVPQSMSVAIHKYIWYALVLAYIDYVQTSEPPDNNHELCHTGHY